MEFKVGDIVAIKNRVDKKYITITDVNKPTSGALGYYDDEDKGRRATIFHTNVEIKPIKSFFDLDGMRSVNGKLKIIYGELSGWGGNKPYIDVRGSNSLLEIEMIDHEFDKATIEELFDLGFFFDYKIEEEV